MRRAISLIVASALCGTTASGLAPTGLDIAMPIVMPGIPMIDPLLAVTGDPCEALRLRIEVETGQRPVIFC